MYIKRNVENTIIEVSHSFPCIVIYGPRQVGKSTVVSHLYEDTIPTVTLDNIEDRMLASSNPRQFLEFYGWPLIIDEIQKVPSLLDEIKIRIDNQRKVWLKNNEERKLMYILTGSNKFELQQGISDSLAGRCGIIDMASFSSHERFNIPTNLFNPDFNSLLKESRNSKMPYRTKNEIFEEIFTGGMPDICTGVSSRDIYYKSYIDTYIEKDVKKLIAASSELQFRNFIQLVALRTAQELRYDDLANKVGIDVRTCKKWISILQTSGIIYLLNPYMANASNRIIKASKLYFMDTGLCAYLCKWPNSEMLEQGPMGGAFFETYVVSEIVKNAYAFNKSPNEFLYYYRDTDKREIDLLYVIQDKIYPIEIKKGINPVKPTKNFNVLSKYNLDIQTGIVIDNCDKIRPINEFAYYYPVYLL